MEVVEANGMFARVRKVERERNNHVADEIERLLFARIGLLVLPLICPTLQLIALLRQLFATLLILFSLIFATEY